VTTSKWSAIENASCCLSLIHLGVVCQFNYLFRSPGTNQNPLWHGYLYRAHHLRGMLVRSAKTNGYKMRANLTACTQEQSQKQLGIGFASYSCKFSEYKYSSFGKNTKRIRNKICLYVVLVRRATRSLYVRKRTKDLFHVRIKKTNTNIRIFGKKHEYPNTKRIRILSLKTVGTCL
jgi:hypothetical protein